MKPVRRFQRNHRAHAGPGWTLIECLVYLGALGVILAVAGPAFSRVLDHVYQVRRVTADISRALAAGERWRAEVRQATAPPRPGTAGDWPTLLLPTPAGEVVYAFDGSNVLRRAAAEADWQIFLPRANRADFVADVRTHVTAWRWELELLPGRGPVRVPPRFSFSAVPGASAQP